MPRRRLPSPLPLADESDGSDAKPAKAKGGKKAPASEEESEAESEEEESEEESDEESSEEESD